MPPDDARPTDDPRPTGAARPTDDPRPTGADAAAAPESLDDDHGHPDRDWETVLEEWSTELGRPGWVTLAEAEAATGVSRSALRTWYRKGDVPSRVDDGPHGPQRMVPLDAVLDRMARSPRLARRAAVPERPHRSAAGGVGATPVTADDGVRALVDLLAAQIERAEARAERAEVALRDALARAAAAEAERDLLLGRHRTTGEEGGEAGVPDEAVGGEAGVPD